MTCVGSSCPAAGHGAPCYRRAGRKQASARKQQPRMRFHRTTPYPRRRPTMPEPELAFDADGAVARLLRFLAVEGVTGAEKAIGQEVVRALVEAGVPRRAIRFDTAHERIPL